MAVRGSRGGGILDNLGDSAVEIQLVLENLHNRGERVLIRAQAA